MSSSPVAIMLPTASAAENTTPMMVSVEIRVPLLEAPDEQRSQEQRRHPAQDRVNVEGEGDPDAGQGDVGHRVGREGHPAHDGEAAHQARRCRDGDGQGSALARVMIVVVVLHRGSVDLLEGLGGEDLPRGPRSGRLVLLRHSTFVA